MGITDDRVLDDERGFRTPAFDYDRLVSFETYGETENLGVGRIIGLLVADEFGYRRLTSREYVKRRDLWGYAVLDTDGVVWQRTAPEMLPLGSSGD